ncbi:SMI1/KNR4 family protein [Caldifermentibacillus hisashii]|jgi:hypothetical protein|uniref:SMI1/KNR4 family protein n=1 Tax=Caldifermentibacillus hisashii TaxID=996558 RepID=A0ABU9K304_9BACI|nr:SMI1/KNR4 family protein [Caldifermentibacillus hisashii]
MKNEVYIEKLITSLKNRLDKNSALYRNTYFGNVVLSKVKFYPACTDEELKKYSSIPLPVDYLQFLKISNGAELFTDDYKGSRALLELYSLDKIFEGKNFYVNNLKIEDVYPIGHLLDNADLVVNIRDLRNGGQYLSLSDGSKKFNYTFQEWLDKFIIAQGNEFWLLDHPYR